MQNLNVTKVQAPGGERTILTDDTGQPLLVELGVRPASTAANRYKCILAVPFEIDGEDKKLPMPVAVAAAVPSFEFRLEMN